ncbi:MAG TPA: DUF6266 family protein [Bacteroidales bacterium]|nr:DUF6266 family protein [Bacteroidales bacterium]
MSKNKLNLPDIFRGKIGNLIISSWKGRTYVKMKPEKIKDARTPDQLIQRTKFATISRILSPLSPFLRLGFGSYAQKMTSYNAAISWNMKKAIAGAGSQSGIDYGGFLFSKGTYVSVDKAAFIPAGNLTLDLSWNPEHEPGAGRDDDRVYAVVVNETLGESNYFADIAFRSSGSARIHLSAAQPGDTVHCYLTVINSVKGTDGKNRQYIADSIYLGKAVLS